MRATRGYLAGFGTSGSLLAGAAAMFVLASAIVAFQGWPQVGGQPAPVSVSVRSASVGSAPSRAGRLLTAATARGAATAVAGTAANGAAPGRVAQPGHVAGLGRGAQPAGGPSSGGTPVANSPGSIASQNAAPSVCSSCAQPVSPPPAVQSAGGTVAQSVSSTGQSVGSSVSNTAGSVASGLSGTSPTAANAVGSAGSTAGSAVSTTANTAASTVNSLTGH